LENNDHAARELAALRREVAEQRHTRQVLENRVADMTSRKNYANEADLEAKALKKELLAEQMRLAQKDSRLRDLETKCLNLEKEHKNNLQALRDQALVDLERMQMENLQEFKKKEAFIKSQATAKIGARFAEAQAQIAAERRQREEEMGELRATIAELRVTNDDKLNECRRLRRKCEDLDISLRGALEKFSKLDERFSGSVHSDDHADTQQCLVIDDYELDDLDGKRSKYRIALEENESLKSQNAELQAALEDLRRRLSDLNDLAKVEGVEGHMADLLRRSGLHQSFDQERSVFVRLWKDAIDR
jgi:hypothetical protein